MKKTTLFCCLLIASAYSFAISDYEKRAAQVKEEVWGAKDPDFASNNVPAEYKNESAVILAKRYNITAQTKSHFKMGIMNFATNKEIIFQNLLHEKVVIQDKAALEDFSEISYQKVSKRSTGAIFIRYKDKLNTYIGARVYKKDGTMKEVMLNEAVVIKDRKDEKAEKLAISDLQIGDILDFYILNEENRELSGLDPLMFVLSGEYLIINLALRGDISNRYGVEYKCVNGAPDLKINRDEDDNMSFDVRLKNVKKYTAEQWINPVRQIPLVRLNIFLNNKKFKAGQISKGMTENEVYQDQKDELQSSSALYKATRNYNNGFSIPDRISDMKKRNGKTLPDDSVIVAVYNGLRAFIYFNFNRGSKVFADKSVNEAQASNQLFCQYLSYSLADYDIENEVIFYPSRYMSRISDMLTTDNLVYMVKAKGSGKDYYMFDDGVFTSFNIIPPYAEGEKAVTLSYGRLRDILHDKEKNLTQGSITFPVADAAKNKRLENIAATLSLTGTPSVSAKRETILTGHLKQDDQKSLLLFEDYYPEFRKDLAIPEDFFASLTESRKTKALADEWHNAFAKAREKYKDGFISDLKNNYDDDPKELTTYKIDKFGIMKSQPEFQFTTEYVYQDWIKKAGNNYLFEAGKLIGSQLKIKEEQRQRSVDIYEPYARMFEYNISVSIPSGYTVEGIDALNKNVQNETGKFISSAKTEGETLVIKTVKEYTHNYETADKWSQMLEFIDAANEFTNLKVLLKKK